MAVIIFNVAVPIQVNKTQELRSPVLRVWSSAGCYVHRMRFRGLKQRQPRLWWILNPNIPTKVLPSTSLYFFVLMSKCFLLTDLRIELHRELCERMNVFKLLIWHMGERNKEGS
jgi:hypothetical protein